MLELQEKNDRWGYWDYSELIDSFEVEVLLQKDDNDYQGDSYLLLRDGDQYGILIFGWGSCSGCDAAQACDSLSDATELRDGLWSSVMWNNRKDTADYLASRDDKLQWYGHEEAYGEFKTEAIAMLSE